jgi:hypothetical protein
VFLGGAEFRRRVETAKTGKPPDQYKNFSLHWTGGCDTCPN